MPYRSDHSQPDYPRYQSLRNPSECRATMDDMAFIYNITFDARHPIQLARFWSDVTGYPITDENENFVRLRAPDHRGVRHILFFKVDDPTPGKNRVHVDLADPNPDTEIARLLQLGAALVDDLIDDSPSWRRGNGTRWVVMQDPEGNEFCVG